MFEIQLIDNLGKDPEARYTPDGDLVVTFPVAVNRHFTRRSGEKAEETIWVDVSVWGQLAETCHQYLGKGRQVYVRGRPEVRSNARMARQERRWRMSGSGWNWQRWRCGTGR